MVAVLPVMVISMVDTLWQSSVACTVRRRQAMAAALD